MIPAHVLALLYVVCLGSTVVVMSLAGESVWRRWRHWQPAVHEELDSSAAPAALWEARIPESNAPRQPTAAELARAELATQMSPASSRRRANPALRRSA